MTTFPAGWLIPDSTKLDTPLAAAILEENAAVARDPAVGWLPDHAAATFALPARSVMRRGVGVAMCDPSLWPFRGDRSLVWRDFPSPPRVSATDSLKVSLHTHGVRSSTMLGPP